MARSEGGPTGIRPSPSARRATQLLNHIATGRGQAYTVSELARALDMNRATCQAVLMALDESGFVRRDPRTRAYTLGLALIPLGEAALSGIDMVDEARAEIDRLATVTGLEAVGAVAMDAEMVIIAVAGLPHRFGSIHIGQRVPLCPPFGTAFVAWADDDAVKQWLDRAGALTDELRNHYLASLAAVRARGYSITLQIRSPERFGSAVREMRARDRHEGSADAELMMNQLLHEEYTLPEGVEPGAHRIEQIAVPVFDPTGAVRLVLGLTGFAHDLTLEQLSSFVTPVMVTAHRLTTRTGGLTP
jgi:DNA-binding IclR family transcriptional regulator